jgi:hypothetical protein
MRPSRFTCAVASALRNIGDSARMPVADAVKQDETGMTTDPPQAQRPSTSPAPDNDPDLLAHCPACGYRLRGLPVERACPECGLAIDRRWQVFGGRQMRRGKRASRFASRAFLVIPLVWVLAGIGLVMMLPMPSRGERDFIFILLIASAGIIFFVMLYRPRWWIAVAPEGLQLHRGRRDVTTYPWSRVGRARYDILRKSLAIHIDGAEQRFRVFRFFGSDIDAVDRCVQAINRANRDPKQENPAQSEPRL